MKELYKQYSTAGFKALKCRGYHPNYNSNKIYRTAKEPVPEAEGFTRTNYQGLSFIECEDWIKQGGWIGWVLPPGVVCLDIDKSRITIDFLKEYCKRQGISPGIHTTDNGVHVLFSCKDDIPAIADAYMQVGPAVTYRVGGKNYLILAPTNNRKWENWVDVSALPELPHDFYPYDNKNKTDVLHVLSWALADARQAGLLHGYDDLDTSYMACLIEAGFTTDEIHRAFQSVFRSEYDHRKTKQMYDRTDKRLRNESPVRGAGSFIQKLKELGLEKALTFVNQLRPYTPHEDWPDPIPFDNYSLLPEFPTYALPTIGQKIVTEVSEVCQVDSGLTASIYLCTLSAAAQKKVEVDLLTHKEPVNLYTIAIYPSGNRKSSVMSTMSKPIYEYQADKQEQARPIIEEAKNAHRFKEARLQKLQKMAASNDNHIERQRYEEEAASIIQEMQDNPIPHNPLDVVDDITTEALGIHMAENGEKLSVYSAEGGLFGIIAGLYNDKGANIDLYLKAHSGDAWSSHRVGRPSNTMRSPSLTLCLAIQPDVVGELGKNSQFRGRGLLARPLYSFCKSTVGYRERQKKSISVSLLEEYNKYVINLLQVPDGLNTLRLTPEAHTVWDEFYNDVEASMRHGCDLEYLQDWGSKLPGAVARISGLLHFAEYGSKSGEIPISAGIVGASCVIGGFYKEHAIATFNLMQTDLRIEAAKLILEYINKHKPEQFKGRDVLANKNAFKTMDDVVPGLKILLERGYIRERGNVTYSVGRPEAVSYIVNSKLYENHQQYQQNKDEG